jgi:hypothetical protein
MGIEKRALIISATICNESLVGNPRLLAQSAGKDDIPEAAFRNPFAKLIAFFSYTTP